MAQVNHNWTYLTVVDGHTVWERLRVIRNFLTDRRQALAVAELSQLKFEATKHEMDEWDRKEAEIMNSDMPNLIQDARDEIEFLEKLEAKLMVEAEKQRVPGKTDREMYEINFPLEAKARIIHAFKTELIAHGSVRAETMSDALKDPLVTQELLKLELINEDAIKLYNLGKKEDQTVIGLLSEAIYKTGAIAVEDKSKQEFVESKPEEDKGE